MLKFAIDFFTFFKIFLPQILCFENWCCQFFYYIINKMVFLKDETKTCYSPTVNCNAHSEITGPTQTLEASQTRAIYYSTMGWNRDCMRNSLFLVPRGPRLSLPDSPRNRFYCSLAPWGPRQIPRGPWKLKNQLVLRIHNLVKFNFLVITMQI